MKRNLFIFVGGNIEYMKKILLAFAASVLFVSTAEARKVSGTVMSGSEVLEGVVVTDGVNFTTTNFKGKFSFEIEDAAEIGRAHV